MRTVLDGLNFSEGPRWRDGALWFSDMHAHRVIRTDLEGNSETVAVVDRDDPSGLGWLPDGRMLVVAMGTQKLLRQEPDGSMVEHADLSPLAIGDINDMIVRADGTAYVGDMGARIHDGGERRTAQTLRVAPDGSVGVGAGGLEAPNGHVLTPDETTLIVAESAAFCLTAFDVAADGTLSNRRTFADLVPESEDVPVAPPDGICLDAEGAVWVADPLGLRVFRVLAGGEVTDSYDMAPKVPVACVLGAQDRRTLLICAADDWRREVVTASTTGAIYATEVTVPGAGKP
ncbi:SMP-30/gluconolactonase/LRE family protein [Candidatus Poriferisocius sp.]|uniref:SMP-30/gluconolactonase/LRE family protein n=1 Tax=Candidatus Poriferisocius sp. TaxID=3101276 RepID=UPI003B027DC4